MSNHESDINLDKASLGIEFGSTRIKGSLIDNNGRVLASGNFDWENKYVNNNWTYDIKDVWEGLQEVYIQIKKEIFTKYKMRITTLGSIGVSGMMHGYLAFDKNNELLVPFRTWRNSTTEVASEKLTDMLSHNIPQRWSIAHLYQAVLNNEKHIDDVEYMTTLAGYVHWSLTNEKVLGIGDASGMFPIDENTYSYDLEMIDIVEKDLLSKGVRLHLSEIFPKPLCAGKDAGELTIEGANLIDPTGDLKPGIPFAPPEGDAGTGMVATNSIKTNTGNVSAGTSVFAMIVLDKPLKKVYPEIDIVTTPLGNSVAMVHVNNCTSEINAWINIFKDFVNLLEIDIEEDELYKLLFNASLEADKELEGMISYGYHSGENITRIQKGYPLFVRETEENFNLENFMKSLIDSAFATLAIGMDILYKEGVSLDSIVAHGGVFKTEGVAQKVLARAIQSEVTLMQNANEGGAWGMAVLAQYHLRSGKISLVDFLDEEIFYGVKTHKYKPSQVEIELYKNYIKKYKKGLVLEVESQKVFEV